MLDLRSNLDAADRRTQTQTQVFDAAAAVSPVCAVLWADGAAGSRAKPHDNFATLVDHRIDVRQQGVSRTEVENVGSATNRKTRRTQERKPDPVHPGGSPEQE